MDTQVLSPIKLFSLPQYLDVPLYQRPYVWEEEAQWRPLWEDLRRLAELHLDEAPDATHFFGAVVMQEHSGKVGAATAYSLVDGQQRLTTLQLFMDAAAAEFEVRGLDIVASQLTMLTHNPRNLGFDGVDRLKVRHTNSDGSPFRDVMLAPPPIDYDGLDRAHVEDQKIIGAHRFFAEQIRAWLDEGEEHDAAALARGLVSALMHGLEIVSITLTPAENSQAIFETLNARGTPLTQADLVKNLVFQELELQGADTRAIYEDRWRLFDDPFWTKEVRFGRRSIQRVSLFINHWLVAHIAEEVSIHGTFKRFKHWLTYETTEPMTEFVQALHAQAIDYRSWIEAAEDQYRNLDRTELFTYRTEIAGVEAVKPLLLWLHDADRGIPREVADRTLDWVESWLLRRALIRESNKSTSRTIAALIEELEQAPTEEVADRTRDFLAALDSPGAYWPSDREVRAKLKGMPAYRALRSRLVRMFLEACEDDARGYSPGGGALTGSRVPRAAMHVEHVLPQQWKAHWPVADLQAELDRDAHVHLFGNLTLLTQALNSTVSNSAWNSGKRMALHRHDVLLINRSLRDADIWDEDAIAQRTEAMIEAFIRTWPTPPELDVHPSARRSVSEMGWIDLRTLVASGLLPSGTIIHGRNRPERRARISDDGRIELDGTLHDSPSGAGRAVLGRHVNGWQYWRLPDGRKLVALRQKLARQHADTRG